jgi:hypothetical protein
MMSDLERRLLKLLTPNPAQLAAIGRVLDGKAEESRPAPTGPLLMMMGDAAKLMGVSGATLWRVMKVGRLEGVEILPGSTRVRRADVEAIAAGLQAKREGNRPRQPGAW